KNEKKNYTYHSQEEITLLARAIHAEAEGEPYIGKVAVGAVLLNRIKNADFPNTLSGVIYQSLALESVGNGRFN
ncbi:MAG: cell wall hydrolase, partial [Clostridiales bacterium]